MNVLYIICAQNQLIRTEAKIVSKNPLWVIKLIHRLSSSYFRELGHFNFRIRSESGANNFTYEEEDRGEQQFEWVINKVYKIYTIIYQKGRCRADVTVPHRMQRIDLHATG